MNQLLASTTGKFLIVWMALLFASFLIVSAWVIIRLYFSRRMEKDREEFRKELNRRQW